MQLKLQRKGQKESLCRGLQSYLYHKAVILQHVASVDGARRVKLYEKKTLSLLVSLTLLPLPKVSYSLLLVCVCALGYLIESAEVIATFLLFFFVLVDDMLPHFLLTSVFCPRLYPSIHPFLSTCRMRVFFILFYPSIFLSLSCSWGFLQQCHDALSPSALRIISKQSANTVTWGLLLKQF